MLCFALLWHELHEEFRVLDLSYVLLFVQFLHLLDVLGVETADFVLKKSTGFTLPPFQWWSG